MTDAMTDPFFVGVTGHRPKKLGGYSDSNPLRIRIKDWLIEQLELLRNAAHDGSPKLFPNAGTRHIVGISGMALGVDQWYAECCIDLSIPFAAYIPCANQDVKWLEHSQCHYADLLSHAADIIYVSSAPYTPSCMQDRNLAMVNASDLFLAVHDGSSGGTSNCLRSIRAASLPLVVFNPSKYVASPKEPTS